MKEEYTEINYTADRGVSIAHYRLPLWAVSHKEHHITAWGEVYVKGKARVIHRDILDAIWLVADSIKIENDRYVIDFMPGKVLKAIGTTKKGTWLYKRINDIYELDVNYRWNSDKFKVDGHFRYFEAFLKLDEMTGRHGQFRGHKYRIKLSEMGTIMERQELRVDFKSFLPDILKLNSNFCRSVVRFFLTHKKGFAIKFSKLVVAVGADMRNASRFRAEVKKEQIALSRFGINYYTEKDSFYYNNKQICAFFKGPNETNPF